MSIHVTVSVFGEQLELKADAAEGGVLRALYIDVSSPDGRVRIHFDADHIEGLWRTLTALQQQIRPLVEQERGRMLRAGLAEFGPLQGLPGAGA